jgi:hypothetical protein
MGKKPSLQINGSSGILVAGFDSYRFYSTLLVLSETVLVLVIESNL